jgi:hypothetical protein
MRKISHHQFIYGLACLIVLSLTASAFGQRSYRRAEGDVERLLEDARSAYENFELEQAESELQRAIALIDRFDMKTPLAADVFVQMGIIIYAKKRDGRRATSFFERAFSADSQVVLDRNSANPTMEKLFETARARARRGSSRRSGSSSNRDRRDYEEDSRRSNFRDNRGERDSRSRGRQDDRRDRKDRYDRRDEGSRDSWNNGGGSAWGDSNRGNRGGGEKFPSRRGGGDRGGKLTHEEMETAPSDRSLELWVSVDPDVNREIYQLFVYFRSAATTSVQKAVMRAAGATEFRVTIPRRYIVGREFVYYFVAESRSGRNVATLRSAQSPFRARLSGDVLGGASRFASGSSLGYGEDTLGGEEHKFAFSLGTGSGFGFVTRNSRPVRNASAILETEGFAPAILHLVVETDAWVNNTLSIGVFGRIQVVEYATLFGGRLQYRTSNSSTSETRLRFGGGYGHVRHLVKIQERNDTTLDGPFCASGGFVYLRKLSDSMKFKTALDYVQLFGESPSYHFDLTLGIELGF